MDRMCEELDEAKQEIEKLRTDYRIKGKLLESLKRAHNEQLIQIKDANAKIDNQARELDEKTDEISVARQTCEDLKFNLKEKEAFIAHLTFADDKLRSEYNEKLQKWEEEKQELVLALYETNARNLDQVEDIRKLEEEIEGLKGLVSVSQKKCLDAERKAGGSKELRQRDDMLFTLEKEKSKVEDQFKWKKEQFKHLEEAHERLRDEFQLVKKEWEQEKCALIDEISLLQEKLDSQTRISEGLQSRLQMCNQALAHEESRRKLLEIQLSESKTCFDNVFAECQEAKSKIDLLANQRDMEIATLRDLLGAKEALHKEIEYQVGKLEQDNQELRVSIKELQEAQIQEGGNCSTSKVRSKLKGLEQMHRHCSKNLRDKEAEWNSRFEKMAGDLKDCRSELESKESVIRELKVELEGLRFLTMQLELQNEETSLMRNKLEGLEQMHRQCSKILKDKEARWSSQLGKMTGDLMDCRLELENKDAAVKELKMKLENCHSSIMQLELQNVETSYKFRGLEQLHGHCSKNLTAKELEWRSQLECVVGELKYCRSELESKCTIVKELKMELEGCHSSVMQLELQNEETSLMVFVLKSVISEVQIKISKENDDLNLKNCEREMNCSLLTEQLEMAGTALVPQTGIDEDHENKALLPSRKIKSCSPTQQNNLEMQEELKRYKEMLEESSKCQLRLNEDALKMENDLEEARNAMCRANEELADKFCETSELEFELEIWKSIAERLKANLEENHRLRREVEASLLAQVSVEVTLKQEKESLAYSLDEKERSINGLQQQLLSLDQEQNFHKLLEERDCRIDDLQQHVMLLEAKFERSTKPLMSQLAEKQAEISLLYEAVEKIKAAAVLKEIEIQEKNVVVTELEDDLSNSQKRLDLLQKTSCGSREMGNDVESELEAKDLQIKKLIHQHEIEKGNLIEDVKKLTLSRQGLLDFVGWLSESFNELPSEEDTHLMEVWGRIVQIFDNNEMGIDFEGDDELFDSASAKENITVHIPSPSSKKVDAIFEERSPLKALNN